MTQNVNNWNTTQYARRAMAIYQQRGNRLRPTVTQAMRIANNEKGIFWLAGKSVAKKKTRGQRNIPGNGERKKFEVSLETWVAYDEIEEYDEDRTTVDEREVIYSSGAMALGRATDIEIYAKMAAAKTTVDGSLDFSAGAFSAAHALRLCAALQDDKVPWDGQVFCGLPSLQWNQFLGNKVVNSAEHVSDDLPFVKSTDTRFWNGVNWFLFVEEDAEDLYPVPGANKQDLFIWHKSAMGWANNTDLRVISQWHNEYDVTSFNMQAKGAATTLQEGKGVARFRTGTDSSIAIV
ncbi:phage capsid protein [Martelella mediterranea]|uniref:Capsid protein n=1 Tax=Martelella mediterranea TaxID=293089 RepID=A0A4R3NR35_9HYPH|nr:phage capsid protein [Martelella mediterranea]TCT34646.1 hypothetical protein EDC90_103340 [Martelella mediterranea]